MHSLARHFHELTSTEREYRQWTTVLLDYNSENSSVAKPERMSSLLRMVRTSPVCVLRKGARLALFDGRPSVGMVEEWLGSLKMGEVSWSPVE